MDIEQLRDIVKRKDGEGFCQFFHQLKPEEILELSEDEYQKIMSLTHQVGREKILRDSSYFFPFLYNIAGEYIHKVISGMDVYFSGLISLFYYDLLLNLYLYRDKKFASALVNKGTCLGRLAEQGVNTAENLKGAINCYDDARRIFKSMRDNLGYGMAMMGKGVSLLNLAIQGINSIENLKEAIKCCDEAAHILKGEKEAWHEYALTLMNKGTSLSRLAEQGVNTRENLKESIKCFDEAAAIFKKRKGAELGYARTMANKGISLTNLAELGVNTIENMMEAIKCYNDAAAIFKNVRANLDYAGTLMNNGNTLNRLADIGVNIIENLKESIKCYNEAALIFKNGVSDFGYARTMMNKGTTLSRLAEQGINPKGNLKEAIKCYDKASLIFHRKTAGLDYAITIMNKGISLFRLAGKGVNTERNFATAMALYEQAEDIFLDKGYLLYFCVASANHIMGLWWRFQATKKEEYLIQARKLCKKALEVAPNITHPAKAHIEELLKRIDAILADKYLASKEEPREEIEKKLAIIVRGVIAKELAPLKETVEYMDKKLDIIIDSIGIQTKEIIDKIKESGEKVSEEVAKGFTNLADDLRELSEEQQRTLLEKLCQLLTDPSFQKKFLMESPPDKRSLIKSIFQRIGKIAMDIAESLTAAFFVGQLYPPLQRLLIEMGNLTHLHPSLVLGMVLLPFIALKNRLSKS